MSATVPLFPLPGVVLFPHMVLPLHIFEPRYRQMTEDALRGDRLVGMTLLKPGWQANYLGSPEVHPIIGVGKIIREERHESGTFDIVLSGLSRARIIEEVPSEKQYRIARVEYLEDDSHGIEDTIGDLKGLAAQLSPLLNDAELDPTISVGTILDLVAARYLRESGKRQSVLEELSVLSRAKLVMSLLTPKPATVRHSKPSPN